MGKRSNQICVLGSPVAQPHALTALDQDDDVEQLVLQEKAAAFVSTQ